MGELLNLSTDSLTSGGGNALKGAAAFIAAGATLIKAVGTTPEKSRGVLLTFEKTKKEHGAEEGFHPVQASLGAINNAVVLGREGYSPVTALYSAARSAIALRLEPGHELGEEGLEAPEERPEEPTALLANRFHPIDEKERPIPTITKSGRRLIIPFVHRIEPLSSQDQMADLDPLRIDITGPDGNPVNIGVGANISYRNAGEDGYNAYRGLYNTDDLLTAVKRVCSSGLRQAITTIDQDAEQVKAMERPTIDEAMERERTIREAAVLVDEAMSRGTTIAEVAADLDRPTWDGQLDRAEVVALEDERQRARETFVAGKLDRMKSDKYISTQVRNLTTEQLLNYGIVFDGLVITEFSRTSAEVVSGHPQARNRAIQLSEAGEVVVSGLSSNGGE